MKEVTDILVTDIVDNDLLRHGIHQQFAKAVDYIMLGSLRAVRLKKRQPPSSGIWYFRITKKRRALCRFEGTRLIIFAIDDHQ